MGLETLLLFGGVAAIGGGAAMQYRGAQMEADAAVASAKRDALVYKEEARVTRRLEAQEEKLMRERLYKTLKRQRGQVAVGGTTMRGSPMALQLQTVADHASDVGRLFAAREAEALKLESSSQMSLLEAKFARKTGKLKKGQALWGGVSQLAMLGISAKLAGLGESPGTGELTTAGKATIAKY